MLSFLFFASAQVTDFGLRMPGQAPIAPKAVPPGSVFTCQVATITDGDTLRCTNGTRVRLAGIDAPEISECARGRQCAAGDGLASKRSLASFATGQTLRCNPVGTSYKRVVAFCSASGLDLSCAQVKAKKAVARYSNRDRVCR
jgi:endonuclease YncB( thermonuclease family)